MKNPLLLILLTIPILLFAQETKKITDKETLETYYVLKSDQNMKHGSYQRVSYDGKIEINGFYKNGVKDSIWEFFNYEGKLEQKYDFSHNTIVYYKTEDKDKDKTYKVIKGSDTTMTRLDRPPLYIGGSLEMQETIWKNISYPQIAKEYGISGEVIISFTIDTSGKTSNHRITKKIGGGCDEEALRVVKLIPDNWLPGMLNGKPVTLEYDKPVRYTLN